VTDTTLGWDSTGDDDTYNPRIEITPYVYERPNSKYITDEFAVWVRNSNPVLDAQAATNELLEVLSELGQFIDELEDHDLAPLIRRGRRMMYRARRKQTT